MNSGETFQTITVSAMPSGTLLLSLLSAVHSVSPIRTLRMKSNTKPWFDIDVLNAVRNRNKHYKKMKQSGRDTEKDNFKIRTSLQMQGFYLKNKFK